MKKVFQISIVLFSLFAITDGYAASYKSQEMIYFEAGQGKAKWSRTANSKVVSGVLTQIKQSGQFVPMLFTAEPRPSKKIHCEPFFVY